MERLSKLVCENLMSRLWEGLWERIILEECRLWTADCGLPTVDCRLLTADC